MAGVLVLTIKPQPGSYVLPKDTPRYLVAFLGLVELVRIAIRPLTLCFRLLANMRAGHILLSLACKIGYV
jgi:F0F1-type ATP synthase membrane subunit a